MADYTKNKNLELPKSNEHYDVGVANKNNMVIDSELHKLDLKNQSQDNLLATKEALNEHLSDQNNPHNVTKSQIGLGNVDNTSDINKPVSIAQQTALNEALYQSNYYTDIKIAELINGAPETLDTLKEIADAIEENKTIVEALDAAIGAKANQSELDTHINNDVIHVTQTDKDNLNIAKEHAESQHARVDATKVEKSENNGNIIVDDEEINVYTPDTLNTIQSVVQNNDTGKLVDSLVIKEVFQSVSEGKTAIASAITDKGIQTDATDTFQIMANNISNIQSSQINSTSLAMPLYLQLTSDGRGSGSMPCHTRLFIPSEAKKIAIKGTYSGYRLSGSGSVKSVFSLDFTNEDFMNKEEITKLITCSTTGSITIKTITASSSTRTTEQINVEYNISDYSDYGHFYYINISTPFLSSAQMYVNFLGTLYIHF